MTKQAFAEADELKKEAEDARLIYESERLKLDQERQDLIKKIHEEIEKEHQKILEEAKVEAKSALDTARQMIEQERFVATNEIREQAASLAVILAGRLIGEIGPEIPQNVHLKRLLKFLESIPVEEIRPLQEDLKNSSDTGLTVATSTELTPEDRGQWQLCLSDRIDFGNKINFVIDPEILGGAELRFPHGILKFTWREQLQHAEKLLIRDENATG